MAVLMQLARILIRENSQNHVVELREVDGDRVLPIVIGLYEAAAIERRLMGQQLMRPLTHELLDSVLQELGARIEKVVISDLRHEDLHQGTYYARLVLRQGDRLVDVDSRPSDAIALSCSHDVPIYAEEHVLAAAQPMADLDPPPPEEPPTPGSSPDAGTEDTAGEAASPEQ